MGFGEFVSARRVLRVFFFFGVYGFRNLCKGDFVRTTTTTATAASGSSSPSSLTSLAEGAFGVYGFRLCCRCLDIVEIGPDVITGEGREQVQNLQSFPTSYSISGAFLINLCISDIVCSIINVNILLCNINLGHV